MEAAKNLSVLLDLLADVSRPQSTEVVRNSCIDEPMGLMYIKDSLK